MEDRFLGCLLGNAIGDALGMPFEELPLTKRQELYGDNRITDFMPGLPYKLRQQEIPAGSVTDDTEMGLTTTESILNNHAVIVKEIADSLLHWLRRDLTWLRGTAQDRNIGNTTRRALERYATGMPCDACGVSSGGCGAAIRMSPLGLCCFADVELLHRTVFPVARITHRNPRKPLAEEGALCVAISIHHLVTGGKPEDLTNFLLQSLGTKNFREQVAIVQEGLSESWSVSTAAARLGTGSSYLATEVVSLALFIFLKNSQSFEEAVIEAVNVVSPAGVDTDSITSIVGALSGCYLGVDAIPIRWQDGVEYRDTINSLSENLFKFATSCNGQPEFRHE